MPESNVHTVTRVIWIRFLAKLNRANIRVIFIILLVTENYGDEVIYGVATKEPTVELFYPRLIFSHSTSYHCTTPFLRDISKSYMHATKPYERYFYSKPPAKLNMRIAILKTFIRPIVKWVPSANMDCRCRVFDDVKARVLSPEIQGSLADAFPLGFHERGAAYPRSIQSTVVDVFTRKYLVVCPMCDV